MRRPRCFLLRSLIATLFMVLAASGSAQTRDASAGEGAEVRLADASFVVVSSLDTQASDEMLEHTLFDLEDLYRLARETRQLYAPLLPPGRSFVLRQAPHPFPIPLAWEYFPEAFRRSLESRQTDVYGVPVYRLRLVEDRATRQLLVYGEDEALLQRINAPDVYDPFDWLRMRYPAAFSSRYASSPLLQSLLAQYDPVRVETLLELIPAADVTQYLYVMARMKDYARGMSRPMKIGLKGMHMGSPEGIVITAIAAVTNGIQLTFSCPAGFTNRLDIYHATDLVDRDWRLQDGPVATSGPNTVIWTGSPGPAGLNFHALGNHDLDSDSDGFSDAFESLVLKSDPADSGSYGVSLAGQVFYDGSESGAVYVQAVTGSVTRWAKTWQTELSAPGPYTNLVAGHLDYWLKAYMDLDGDRQHEDWEPWGLYDDATLYPTTNLSSLDIVLKDQSSIWGAVDYTGAATGDIYVVAVSQYGWDSIHCAVIPWAHGEGPETGDVSYVSFPADYAISGLSSGAYYLRAWIDEDHSGTYTPGEPGGQLAAAPLAVSNRLTGCNFTIGLDSDSDGLPDWWEFEHGTGADNPDSDGDDMSDGWEVAHGFDPLDSLDADEDRDGDGFLNIYEYVHGSDPDAPESIPDPTLVVTAGQSIQTAINTITNDYGIILMASGTYTGAGNRNLDFSAKRITLISETGHENTTIDAQNAGRGFKFSSGETRRSVVARLTVKNGNSFATNLWQQQGGGIYCSNASPTIINSVIVSNSAFYGGGIYSEQGSPAVRSSRMVNNSASLFGGGIYSGPNSGLLIDDCQIVGNYSKVFGGGVSCRSSSVMRIMNSTISANIGTTGGGGISVEETAAPEVDHVIVNGNVGSFGGGLYISDDASPIISASVVQANSATGSMGGGVFCVDSASPYIVNSVFEGNTAVVGGGAFYFGSSSKLSLVNSVIYGNHADIEAGAVYANSSAASMILNTVIWSNSAPYKGPIYPTNSALSVTYCNVEGAYPGNGNINADPLFTRLGYRLTQNSPCIGAGFVDDDPQPDIDGESRGTATWLLTGAVYFNWPYAYEQDTDTWFYFNEFDTLWVNGFEAEGWATIGESTLASGWCSFNWPYAYCFANTTWYYINEADTQWVSKTSTGEWRTLGAPAVSPDIGIDQFIDANTNGMADIWEMRYFGNLDQPGDADFDGDGLSNLLEYENSTDPTQNVDADGDSLSDDAEVYYGADPYNWDTDGDLMPDGWEVEAGLNPLNPSDAAGDSDGDGLSNFEEMQHGTDPFSADSDGDGVNDSTEVTQGSNPMDADDGGNAGSCVQIDLTVGDHSVSHSERYALQVGFVNHVATGFGVVSTGTYSFVKGKTYPFSVRWIATDDPTPDYDYTARIGGFPPSGSASSPSMSGDGFTILDPEGILGEHNESTNDFAAGKSGTLIVDAPPDSAAETENADPSLANTIDPINVINGNVTLHETDLILPAPGIPLEFSRSYQSRTADTNISLGSGWYHNYDLSLTLRPNANYKGTLGMWRVLATPDGKRHWFRQSGSNWESPPENSLSLLQIGPLFRVDAPGGLKYLFNTNGVLQTISDAFGNAVTLTYAGIWPTQTLSRAEHNNGQYLDFAFAGGRLTTVTTPSTNLSLSLSYNASGWLTNAVRHVSGQDESFGYRYDSTLGVLTQRVNAVGERFDYTYESSEEGPRGTSMRLEDHYYAHDLSYTGHGTNRTQVTYFRDGDQQNLLYAWDPVQRVITGILGPNSQDLGTLFTRDSGMNVVTQTVFDATLGESLVSARTFDINHNVLTESIGYNQQPSTLRWTYVWNQEWSLPSAITDPDEGVTEIDYTNGLPSVVRIRTATNATSTATVGYTTNGLPSAVTNANGHWTRYAYDAFGNATSSIPQLGPSAAFSYTTLGHLQNMTLPGQTGNRTTVLDTDGRGRVRSITWPDSLQEHFAYNSSGKLTNQVDRAGRVTRFEYAPAGRLTATIRQIPGGGAITNRVVYDQQFNSLVIQDALARNVEAYALDSQNRITAVTNLEQQVMSVQYGLGGIVHSVTRFDGTVISNAYDGQARLMTQTLPGLTNHFSYTPGGLLKTIGNGAGTVSNAYDLAGRLTQTTSSGITHQQTVAHYAYDPVGNITNTIDVCGTNSYRYDAAERIASMQFNRSFATPLIYTNAYTPYNGLVAQVSNVTAGITASYAFDTLDRVTNIVWRNWTNGILCSFAYGYNAAGMITNVAREAGRRTAYQYDSLDRLTVETVYASGGGVSNAFSWKYDLAGNRTQEVVNAATTDYALGAGNRIAAFGTSGMVSHDAAGSITNIIYNDGRDLDIEWNSRYQLVSVSTNGFLVESYTYGPLGQRISISDGATTNWLVYDGPHVVAEVDDQGDLIRSYQYGSGIDNLLSMTIHTGTVAETLFALTDHLGSIHAWADAEGGIVEQYEYTTWGEVSMYDGSGAPLSKTAIGNRYLWQGREYSWTTGLYYFRARWYDPVLGRWFSNDPIGISGGLNQYVFCGDNPINFKDPYGLFQSGMFFRGLGGSTISGVGAFVGWAAATTGVGIVPGAALGLNSSYCFGANVGNMINAFRDVEAAPTGPLGTATVLATDNQTARTIAEAGDLAIPLVLSLGTSPVAWSRLPGTATGPAGTLLGTLFRSAGDPAVTYPLLQGFQHGQAGLTAYDSWNWAWNDKSYNDGPCK